MTHVEDENRRLRGALVHTEAWFANSNRDKPSELFLRERNIAALAAEPASGEAIGPNDPRRTPVERRFDVEATGADSEYVSAPPPPLMQGEEERARGIIAKMDRSPLYHVEILAAALRQRADEATRVERERIERHCYLIAVDWRDSGQEQKYYAFEYLRDNAIRARITPGGEP